MAKIRIRRYIETMVMYGKTYQALVTKDGDMDRAFVREEDLQNYISYLKEVWRSEILIEDRR